MFTIRTFSEEEPVSQISEITIFLIIVWISLRMEKEDSPLLKTKQSKTLQPHNLFCSPSNSSCICIKPLVKRRVNFQCFLVSVPSSLLDASLMISLEPDNGQEKVLEEPVSPTWTVCLGRTDTCKGSQEHHGTMWVPFHLQMLVMRGAVTLIIITGSGVSMALS